jgi:hypothetical protein
MTPTQSFGLAHPLPLSGWMIHARRFFGNSEILFFAAGETARTAIRRQIASPRWLAIRASGMAHV